MYKAAFTLISSLALTVGVAWADTLQVKVTIPEGDRKLGALRVGVFKSQAQFDTGEPELGLMQEAVHGENTIAIADLPAGTYGLSVFLDRNDDEELNSGLFGAPSEPYGFSRNPTIRFSAPKFDDWSFQYGGSGGELVVDLLGI